MADYKATTAEFQSVANAIRTKGGTQAQLEWPTGFVSAVQAIPTGGGSSLIPYYAKETDYYKYIDSAGDWDPEGYSEVTAIFFNVTPGKRYILYLSNESLQQLRVASYNIDVHAYSGTQRVPGQSLLNLSSVAAYSCYSIAPTNQYLAVCSRVSFNAYLFEQTFN